MKQFWLTSQPRYTQFILLIRIFVGAMLIRHGWGLFNAEGINDNESWLIDVNFPFARISAYIGKTSELLGGILLIPGLFVRFIAIPVAFTMFVITFIIGNGEIFTDRVYPFLLMLVYINFFFTGPGKWSLDYYFFDRKKKPAYTQASPKEDKEHLIPQPAHKFP